MKNYETLEFESRTFGLFPSDFKSPLAVEAREKLSPVVEKVKRLHALKEVLEADKSQSHEQTLRELHAMAVKARDQIDAVTSEIGASLASETGRLYQSRVNSRAPSKHAGEEIRLAATRAALKSMERKIRDDLVRNAIINKDPAIIEAVAKSAAFESGVNPYAYAEIQTLFDELFSGEEIAQEREVKALSDYVDAFQTNAESHLLENFIRPAQQTVDDYVTAKAALDAARGLESEAAANG